MLIWYLVSKEYYRCPSTTSDKGCIRNAHTIVHVSTFVK